LKLKISDKIIDNYPDLRIGVLIAKDIKNDFKNDNLENIKKDSLKTLMQNFSLEQLIEDPFINAWRETYRSFGVKPKKYPPTAENFIKGLLKGRNFPTINIVVDSYLVIEIEFLLPIGGYDIDKITDNIHLKHSQGNEEFLPLGGADPEYTKEGEIIYSDEKKVLTRKWNYRDCDSTKITTSSKNIVLFTEAPLSIIPTEQIIKSLNKLKNYLIDFCGGSISIIIADVKEDNEWELDI
jgi:DNA/RNA-binding domain of Phe-tRNA-synthetase-like protein